MMFAHAERRNLDHEHVALDLYEGKCQANAQRIECSGLGEIFTAAGDATDLDACLAAYDEQLGRTALFDTVFVDAPCSGTGTMRRHGEIPWRLTQRSAIATCQSFSLSCCGMPRAALVQAGSSSTRRVRCCVPRTAMWSPSSLGRRKGRVFAPMPLSDALAAAGPAYWGATKDIAAHEIPIGTFQSYPHQGGFDGHFCARFIRV